jgi:hypothetical protein
MKALPARRRCPKCGKTKAKAAFGLRVMGRLKNGLPERVQSQSWCQSCRSSKG